MEVVIGERETQEVVLRVRPATHLGARTMVPPPQIRNQKHNKAPNQDLIEDPSVSNQAPPRLHVVEMPAMPDRVPPRLRDVPG